jgi:hypothetical protein
MEATQHQNPSFELIPLTPGQHAISTPPKRTIELPFFYLTKKKSLLQKNITYEGVDESGRPVHWTVRPNRDPDIGVPGIDAHEIWTRLIIPTIDDHRLRTARVPEIIPLGGVRMCLRMLGWGTGGHQARRLLRGLNQIGAAWCEADFFVSTTAEANQTKLVPVKGKFSRLSIYAIGEKHLTDDQLKGGKFDFDFDLDATIYIQLHKLEVATQESLDRRYIDNQYMFSVEPTGRRWLEIMAPKIFGVVKNKGTHCEVRYSWYVKQHHTLKQQFSRGRITDQMNHVVADHIISGYILKPEYRIIKESDQEINCIIRYQPGPMAYESTKRIRANLNFPGADKIAAGETEPAKHRSRQRRLPLRVPQDVQQKSQSVIFDYRIVAELTAFGMTEADARQHIASLPPEYPIQDVLEYARSQIQRPGSTINNAAGFVIDLLKQRKPLPPTFTPTSVRKAQEEAILREQQAMEASRMADLEAEQKSDQEREARLDLLKLTDQASYQSLFEQGRGDYQTKERYTAERLPKDSPVHEERIRYHMKKALAADWQPKPAPQGEADRNSTEIVTQTTNSPIRQVGSLYETDPDVSQVLDLKAVLATLQLPAPKQPAPASTSPETASKP